jgi:ADP-L-glycero-D-manno-heptose 6-epimerase
MAVIKVKGNGKNRFSDMMEISRLKPPKMCGYSRQLSDLHAERSGLLGRIVGLKFFNAFGPNEYHKGDMVSVVFKPSTK